MVPQRARPCPNKAGIKWISHNVTKFVKSSKTSKSKSAVRKKQAEPCTIITIKMRIQQEALHTYVCTNTHAHTLIFYVHWEMWTKILLYLVVKLYRLKTHCLIYLYFCDRKSWRWWSDLYYDQGVNNETQRLTDTFLPWKMLRNQVTENAWLGS